VSNQPRKPDAIFEPGETPTDNRPAIYEPPVQRSLSEMLEDLTRGIHEATLALAVALTPVVLAVVDFTKAADEMMQQPEVEKKLRSEPAYRDYYRDLDRRRASEVNRNRSRDDLARKRREQRGGKAKRF
jgi:hypothetical protein